MTDFTAKAEELAVRELKDWCCWTKIELECREQLKLLVVSALEAAYAQGKQDACLHMTDVISRADSAGAFLSGYLQGVEDAAKVADKYATCNCHDFIRHYSNYHEPNATHFEAEEIAAKIRALVKDGAK